MSKILTEDEARLYEQELRCRSALKMIDVPEHVIWNLRGPILFQVAHLCCVIDQPMHWRDALIWCDEHKGEILHHAMEIERKKSLEQNRNAGLETNRAADGVDVGAPRERQPVRMGYDGIPVGGEENPA